MRHIVDAIAAQGRHGDDELIHVSKNEIAGLDGLSRHVYGRDLPRNPRTGLKEASWLQAILPAAVGLGAGIITMNPVVGAAAGAAAGAGTSAAEGGTTEQALMAGVMGGVAGYGAAGIGAGLANAGAATAAAGAESGAGLVAEGSSAALPTTATGGAEAVANTAAPATTTATGATGTGAAAPTTQVTGETLNTTNLIAQPKSGAGLTIPKEGITSLGGQTGVTTNTLGVTAPTNTAATTSIGGGTGVTAPPVQGSAPTLTGAADKSLNWSSLASKEGLSNLSTAGMGAMGGASLVNGQPAPIDIPGEKSTENPYEAEYYQGPEGEIRTRAVLKAAQGGLMGFADYDAADAQPDGGYRPGGAVGYAGGGGIGFVRSIQPGGEWGAATADMYGAVQEHKPGWLQGIEPGGFIGATVPGKMDWEDKKRAEAEAEAQKQRDAEAAAKKASFAQSLKEQQAASVARATGMAAGGIASFGRGRYLQGPGDGMSDSIPANIDGKQPARLATGEFVIPADVVSHLGNGDSSAGAKQLHSMMDRARMARTGTKKQGKQINPKKVMPV